MEDRLAVLIDERDIVSVIHQLFVATDQKDWAGVEAGAVPNVVEIDVNGVASGC